MGMTEEEMDTLVEKKLLEKKAEIVKALMGFNANPSAKTFKDAENIPDRLLGEAMDAVMSEVVARKAEDVKIQNPAKKNSAIRE